MVFCVYILSLDNVYSNTHQLLVIHGVWMTIHMTTYMYRWFPLQYRSIRSFNPLCVVCVKHAKSIESICRILTDAQWSRARVLDGARTFGCVCNCVSASTDANIAMLIIIINIYLRVFLCVMIMPVVCHFLPAGIYLAHCRQSPYMPCSNICRW